MSNEKQEPLETLVKELDDLCDYAKKNYGLALKRIATLEARVKELEKELAADRQQDRHIDKHIAGMVEIETKLLNERIATLEARVKELENELNAHQEATKFTSRMHAAVLKELEGELAECQRLSKLHLQARMHPEKH